MTPHHLKQQLAPSFESSHRRAFQAPSIMGTQQLRRQGMQILLRLQAVLKLTRYALPVQRSSIQMPMGMVPHPLLSVRKCWSLRLVTVTVTVTVTVMVINTSQGCVQVMAQGESL
jgi:hypothetical protein